MMTNADIATLLVNNLNDVRQFSVQSFLSRLIARTTYNPPVAQYRITNTTTGAVVTTLADFILAIDALHLEAGFNYRSKAIDSDKTHPFVVVLNNFSVELTQYCADDDIYYTLFGVGTKKIVFTVNYLADGDAVLPLKITSIKLV
jgi:hypothetical protein